MSEWRFGLMVPGVFVFFFLVQPMFGGLLFSANAQIGVRDEKKKEVPSL